MAEHNELGKTGEQIARTFLMKQGFSVSEMNFRTRFGEIDIIAEKDNTLRFVEVKSVKVRDVQEMGLLRIRPEENLTRSKWDKLIKTIEIYMSNRKNAPFVRWQVDLACVYINPEKREGRVILHQNVHVE